MPVESETPAVEVSDRSPKFNVSQAVVVNGDTTMNLSVELAPIRYRAKHLYI